MAEVTQRLLGRTLLAFNQWQLIAEINYELSVATVLPGWKDHDAWQVEVMIRIFLLTEVADHVVAIRTALTQYVKVESVDFVPNVFVIEEEFGDVTEVLSVDLLLLCIKLKHWQSFVSVNLITRWTPDITSLRVRLQLKLVFKELESKGADV